MGADIGSQLVTIHGQSEQQRLASPERQREVLDRAAGPELTEELARYRAAYTTRQAANAELVQLRREARNAPGSRTF